jgi:hypothetical protein
MKKINTGDEKNNCRDIRYRSIIINAANLEFDTIKN